MPKTVSSTSTMEFSPIASQWPEGRRVERTTGIVSVDRIRESQSSSPPESRENGCKSKAGR